jgi:hypothetical protein
MSRTTSAFPPASSSTSADHAGIQRSTQTILRGRAPGNDACQQHGLLRRPNRSNRGSWRTAPTPGTIPKLLPNHNLERARSFPGEICAQVVPKVFPRFPPSASRNRSVWANWQLIFELSRRVRETNCPGPSLRMPSLQVDTRSQPGAHLSRGQGTPAKGTAMDGRVHNGCFLALRNYAWMCIDYPRVAW